MILTDRISIAIIPYGAMIAHLPDGIDGGPGVADDEMHLVQFVLISIFYFGEFDRFLFHK